MEKGGFGPLSVVKGPGRIASAALRLVDQPTFKQVAGFLQYRRATIEKAVLTCLLPQASRAHRSRVFLPPNGPPRGTQSQHRS